MEELRLHWDIARATEGAESASWSSMNMRSGLPRLPGFPLRQPMAACLTDAAKIANNSRAWLADVIEASSFRTAPTGRTPDRIP